MLIAPGRAGPARVIGAPPAADDPAPFTGMPISDVLTISIHVITERMKKLGGLLVGHSHISTCALYEGYRIDLWNGTRTRRPRSGVLRALAYHRVGDRRAA